jgi:4-amino-4-deoxy-L-arabinose transferase-like glycosyltransferase
MSWKLINIIAVLILLILSLAVLSNTMSKPVGRDEQMYCSGAVLLAQGKMIYRDFSYAAQLPYHPLLCATLFKLFNSTHYLLVCRIVSCVCDILVMLGIVGIYRHIFGSFKTSGMILGLCAVVLYVFNPLVDYANGFAWNHDVVIFCVVFSFWLFISTDFQKKSKYWRIAVIGALLTFATFMRITTALIELLFFVLLLCAAAGSIKERLKNALPFLLAGVVVSIWPVWVIAQAPRAFFLNIVKIPVLYGRWLHEIGMVFNKFSLTISCLTSPGYLVLVLLVIYLYLSVLFLRRKLKISSGINLMLAALLPVIFFLIALIPPTMWRQYLAVPVPFLVICLAFPLLYLRKLTDKAGISKHFKTALGITIFCSIVALISYPIVLYRTPIALVPESWAPIEIHKVSEEIVEKTNDPGMILTLGPILALEGGGRIYTELSAGAIIYRIADSLSAEERQITHTAGVQTLAEILEKNPPSAVILHVEMGRLEEPIYKSVVTPDWKIKDYENGPIVYFRP